MSKDAWNPQQYDKFKTERAQPFFDLIQLLEPTKDPTVVDLGCGTGDLTAELHNKTNAKKTWGLDSSDQMLAKALAFETATLNFLKADISAWKQPEQFDIIFSNAALQWCPGHETIIKNLKESLREHGQIAIQMPMNHDYPTHTLAQAMSDELPWKTLMGDNSYQQHKIMLTAEQYATLLFDLGFKKQKVITPLYGHVLESREGVIEWVKGTLLTRFQKTLSEDDYNRFFIEFKKRLFEMLPDKKPFFYPFKRILIWARL